MRREHLGGTWRLIGSMRLSFDKRIAEKVREAGGPLTNTAQLLPEIGPGQVPTPGVGW